MKHLIKIMYVGTDFCGYQVQPGKRTVQKVLQDAIEKVYGERFDVKGCSRTDSGVHANAFYATFDVPDKALIPLDRVPPALNSHLDDDISIVKCIGVNDDFHVRHDVLYKEYVYQIQDGPIRDPFYFNRAYFVPSLLDNDSVALMNKAVEAFTGNHNFKSFMSAGSNITDCVRDIKYINVQRQDNLIKLYIAANGFLYNMVRIISGTLLDVARKKIVPEDIADIIKAENRSFAGPTLPACGLYLNKVVFTGVDF